MRSTPCTTKQAKTITNNRKHKKKHRPTRATHISAGCRAELFVQTAGYTHEQLKYLLKQKNIPVGRAKLIQLIKPSKKSRTSHTNKKTRRKTLRQHNPPRHISALRYKIQTHASHRAKEQKPVLTRISQENLPKARKKIQKNTVFHVKHSIFYLQISPKSIEYYIAKSKNYRKTVNNIGFTVAM